MAARSFSMSAGGALPFMKEISPARAQAAAGGAGHNRSLACQRTHFHLLLFAVGGFGAVPREIVSHHGFAGLRPLQPILVTHRQMNVALARTPVLDHADV